MIQLISTLIALCICGLMIIIPTAAVLYLIHVLFKKFGSSSNKTQPAVVNANNSSKTTYFYSNIKNVFKIPTKINNKILLGMGEEPRQEYFSNLFGKYGFSVETALGGDPLLNKIRNDEYALVILDLVLPYKGGLDILEEIKGKEDTFNYPRMIVLTNLGTDMLKVKLPDLGVLSLIGPFQYYTENEVISDIKETLRLINNMDKNLSVSNFIKVSLSTPTFNYANTQWSDVLKRNNFTAEQKKWIEKLQIPYKRHPLNITQCEDEIIRLFADLSIFTDSYLKRKGKNLESTIKKLNSYNTYYNNILYTLECIAESEVENHYRGGIGFNSDFSYQILQGHVSPDLVEKMKKYLIERAEQIAPPNKETIEAFGLAANGLPYTWWDPEGTIRERKQINSEEQKILRLLPVRRTAFLEIEQCRLETLKLYIRVVRALKEATDLPSRFQKIVNHLSIGFQFSNSNSILDDVIKLCENAVREKYPATKTLNIEENANNIKQVFGKQAGEILLNEINNQKVGIQSPSDETLNELYSNNPFIWRIEVRELRKSITNENYIAKYNQAKGIIEKYKTFSSLDQIYYELCDIFAAYNKIISLFFYYKHVHTINLPIEETKPIEIYDFELGKIEGGTSTKIIDPPAKKELSKKLIKLLFKNKKEAEEFTKINKLELNDEDLIQEIKAIFFPRRRKISIDQSKIGEIEKDDQFTVQKLTEFIGDDLEEDLSIRSEQTQQTKASTSLEDIFSSSNAGNDDVIFDETQLGLIKQIAENGFKISKKELELFAKNHNSFASSLISNIDAGLIN